MTTEIIILSIFGSLLGKLLILRTMGDLPKNRRPNLFSFAFILSAFIDIILGFAFTYVQYKVANTMNVLLAIQISATAPLIATSLMKAIPSNSVYDSEKEEKK
jgi:multisubunit Na+/H+ antiporter MnhG subunit